MRFVTAKVSPTDDTMIRQGIEFCGTLHCESGAVFQIYGEPTVVPDSNLWGSTKRFAEEFRRSHYGLEGP